MVITLNRKNKETGLRALKPSKDLNGVATLIEEAFASELDQAGRIALREMHRMGHIGFLLGWLDFLSPDVNSHLNGFVWLEDGQIVGNITVNRNAPGAKHWFISNVAVSKSYRGRGIARTLMDAAVEFVKEMNGYEISLQVRQGNQPAIRLYEAFGFKTISATSYLYLPTIRDVPYYPLPDGVTMRPHNMDIHDISETYTLARSAISVNIQNERPLRQSQFRINQTETRFGNFWRRVAGLAEVKHYVITREDNKFVATLGIDSGHWRNEHRLSIMVHPDFRGMLEKPLISHALSYLSRFPAQAVTLQHPYEHQEGIEALKSFNFIIQRTHTWMKLNV